MFLLLFTLPSLIPIALRVGGRFSPPFSIPSLSTPGAPRGFYLWLWSYPFPPLELLFARGLAFVRVSSSFPVFDSCGMVLVVWVWAWGYFGLGLGVHVALCFRFCLCFSDTPCDYACRCVDMLDACPSCG